MQLHLATAVWISAVLLTTGCATGARSAAPAHAPLTYNDNSGQTAGDAGAAAGASDVELDADRSRSGRTEDVTGQQRADVSAASGDVGKQPKESDAAQDIGTQTADATTGATCAGKCGAAYDKTLPCQCNDLCVDYGNCCADYFPLCAPQKLSCKGRCDTAFDKGLPCQCTWDCSKYGSCCDDFLPHCAASANLTFIEAKDGECAKDSDWVATQQIKDGDTLTLKSIHGGDSVRFLVVNTPEIAEKQCFALQAQKYALDRIKNSIYPGKGGYHVCLVADPNQPDKDKYGRLLRYVYYKEPTHPKPVQLNARLVRLGYGQVYYPFAAGNAHEKISLWMQEQARLDKLGGWGACSDWK